MGLEPSNNAGANESETVMESINALFDLPSTKQAALWYHAAAGWPEKETFLRHLQRKLRNVARPECQNDEQIVP